MTLDQNLIRVLEMMMTRIRSGHVPDAAFAIPGRVANPDNVSDQEADALFDAGFVWVSEMYDDEGGYVLQLKEPEND